MVFAQKESSACGVGFLVKLQGGPSRDVVTSALSALSCVEHRGACSIDPLTGDGSGILTEVPAKLFGYEPGTFAIASLLTPQDNERHQRSLAVFTEVFEAAGFRVLEFRDVPVDTTVLGPTALERLPILKHAVLERPKFIRTEDAFLRELYLAKQKTRTAQKKAGIHKEFYFASLSPSTIVYKALVPADRLSAFYLDLQREEYESRFALFHRRFSTNTSTTWDKAQPFRLIAHNGEINTLSGNRSWAYSREQSLGLPVDELLTHAGISDSGSFNEMVEALKYRSSIPFLGDILSIMIPPAGESSSFSKLWRRAMEPWDGPAFIAFCDGETIGARLDRNGFRPCRWARTEDTFYLSSEAGVFSIDDQAILSKGMLRAGSGVAVFLETGEVFFNDPRRSGEFGPPTFDARLFELSTENVVLPEVRTDNTRLFQYVQEDIERHIQPMAADGKEAIGSMGDTARPAVLSSEIRSFFDFFYQNFAQVTNPPVDYIRERVVTDLEVALGSRPNVFRTKELLPPLPAYKLASPILSLAQCEALRQKMGKRVSRFGLSVAEIKTTFRRSEGVAGFAAALERIVSEAEQLLQAGCRIIILSDRDATWESLPLPSLLAVSSLVKRLDYSGQRLKASIVVDSGEVRSTHHVASLIAYGASAVCPYLALALAREHSTPGKPEDREANLIKALETGLLRIMAKMGISVLQSYQGSRLFTPLGLSAQFLERYFTGQESPIGGLGLEDIVRRILEAADFFEQYEGKKLPSTYSFMEQPKGEVGEKHSMTAKQARMIHTLVRTEENREANYQAYLAERERVGVVNLRHMLRLVPAMQPLPIDEVQSQREITSLFGSGAMSFGAISAESQRDIIKAMHVIGGRSNSGEGGENPYYYQDGTTATIKQIASARFGVTARYIVTGEELQIKIAQGAKPGEGGQLMRVKVDEHIARARHAKAGIDLISPPPMHDIYSIEDLKELIYELKQVHPTAPVSVKLVAGANIGTIAVGVAKAGADIIHVAGGDGGTGAASLTSMKHAGLPWELGLVDVHTNLLENNLRRRVRVRVDGGLSTGADVIIAAIFGADEFDFGKLLLVAQGCIMARVCEKNTCPTGIATHAEKFKAKYKGTPEHSVELLRVIADDARETLAQLGVRSLRDLRGRTEFLEIDPERREMVAALGLDFSALLAPSQIKGDDDRSLTPITVSDLNTRLVADAESGITYAGYKIASTDRAVLATLSGTIAQARHQRAVGGETPSNQQFQFDFTGSAGQGFGVFLVDDIDVRLTGEANDSVAKSMSGGSITIVPPSNAPYIPEESAIIGNCALYGATGGTLFVRGIAGDRFAVRNSGARAVVESCGFHACEYMTEGMVVILGPAAGNAGAGMTGGVLYLLNPDPGIVNEEYLREEAANEEQATEVLALLSAYATATDSERVHFLVETPGFINRDLRRFVPRQ